MAKGQVIPLKDGRSTKTFFGHPVGLRTLFFTEMWERFSYYGNRALLVLYMVAATNKGGLGFSPEQAAPIYAMYTSLVYLLTVPGGWLADKFLGLRRSVLYGGITIMIGHILMTFPSQTSFFVGLAFIVLGTGLLKPCISVMVGQLYEPEDVRRAAGYTTFYMGINLGALVAPLVTGFLAQSNEFGSVLKHWHIAPEHSWHWGFGAAAVGMLFGLIQYIWTGRNLGSTGLKPVGAKDAQEARSNRRTIGLALAASVVLVVGLVSFNKTAVYPDRVTWRGSEIGVVVTGYVSGRNHPVALNDGKPVHYIGEMKGLKKLLTGKTVDSTLNMVNTLTQAMGVEAAGVLLKTTYDQEVSLGLMTDSLFQLNQPMVKDDINELLPQKNVQVAEVRIKELWVSSENNQLTLRLRLMGDSKIETRQLASFHMFDTLLPENVKVKLLNKMLVRANSAGRVEGSADGLHLKVGGLNSKNTKNGYSLILLIVVIAFFGKLFTSGEWTSDERLRLRYIFILFCGAAIFWGIFEQAGSTLTLFAERSSNNSVFGWVAPSAYWQSMNPFLILCLGSAFSWFWIKLGRHNPSYTAKFGFGLLFAGLGFLLLVGGATLAKDNDLVSPMWLFGVYFLHTIGEMFLSPVGLEAMNKLSPARLMGSLMGVWFLAASVGNLIGGSVAGYYDILPLPALFLAVGVSGCIMAALFFAMVKPVKKMMG